MLRRFRSFRPRTSASVIPPLTQSAASEVHIIQLSTTWTGARNPSHASYPRPSAKNNTTTTRPHKQDTSHPPPHHAPGRAHASPPSPPAPKKKNPPPPPARGVHHRGGGVFFLVGVGVEGGEILARAGPCSRELDDMDFAGGA